jgi:excisionase family DNA binding protein
MKEDTTVAMLSAAEVAMRLGLSKQSIYRAAARGRLPARRWNGKLVFLVPELNRFFESLPARPVTQSASGRP